jgi:hypothetical protein
MNKICLFIAISLIIYCPIASSAIKTTLFVGLTSDDNITRAELDNDVEKDNILELGIFSTYKHVINSASHIFYSASAEHNQYQDFDELSQPKLGLSANYQIQPFQGYTAAWYSVSFAYQLLGYDNKNRNGSHVDVGFDFGKRLTDIISLRAGYHIEKTDANANPPAFDTDNSRLYINMDYKLNNQNTFFSTLGMNDGDIVVTATPTLKIMNASHGNIIDDSEVFGSNRFAYRLTATTTTFTLGDHFTISPNQAIDFSLLHYSSSAYGGNDYDGMILQLTYLHNF